MSRDAPLGSRAAANCSYEAEARLAAGARGSETKVEGVAPRERRIRRVGGSRPVEIDLGGVIDRINAGRRRARARGEKDALQLDGLARHPKRIPAALRQPPIAVTSEAPTVQRIDELRLRRSVESCWFSGT